LRDGLTIELIGEPEMGAVARLTGLMAVTLEKPDVVGAYAYIINFSHTESLG